MHLSFVLFGKYNYLRSGEEIDEKVGTKYISAFSVTLAENSLYPDKISKSNALAK